ncbi:HIT domain-containing protein [Alteromonas sediminis]|uniref:HIT domain-containing protein n=1 Tax=Alteromonas sediminis TaxID=2259342 RepID=A0A3N5Y403_9ALTE|nr:HIT domain-containing protein [Alteromonas sediminis]
MFSLHPQLAKDSTFVCDLELCQLRLINDASYPWCILVPKKEGTVEVTDLTAKEYHQLQLESLQLTRVMQTLFTPKKMNIASLGNMVPQLHVHHIARYESDPAWPRPVWGQASMTVYEEHALKECVSALKSACYSRSFNTSFTRW